VSDQDEKFEEWMDEKTPMLYQGKRVMLHRYDTMSEPEEKLARSAWDASVKANSTPST